MLLVIGFAGCQSPPPSLVEQLHDEDEVVRIRAIVAAAEQGRRDLAPLLVDRLEEDSESVRFFAIASLRRLTGTDHGFEPEAPLAQRQAAVARWRAALAASDAETVAAPQPQ